MVRAAPGHGVVTGMAEKGVATEVAEEVEEELEEVEEVEEEEHETKAAVGR